MMIRRLLVANRGEIAVRIIRACRELGVESVAVYSAADAHAPHVSAADYAVAIGLAPAADSYLSIPHLLDAARASGADAVHPGYGFLSENAAFADACERAGLVFVGPPSGVIAQMGSKIDARRVMQSAGVPVVPGEVPDDQSDAGVGAAVDRIGLPALVKASAGGGGKGMRVVREPQDVAGAIQAARREASAAFGDGTLYVERLIDRPRHVEVQIFADRQGRTMHLFERECSLQRRHQKVIEETPSPALTPALRGRITDAAVAAARAVRYVNAGTVEFLLEGSGDQARFYFLEMNTRLQVEHAVTEAVVGVDLVRAQILVAAGEPLPWPEGSLSQRGHAIEARIYAEDPAAGFLPQAGHISSCREPGGPGVRVDSGVAAGSDVSVYYDPMLAKVIAYAETRDLAIARLRRALAEFTIAGIRTNVAFLRGVLDHPRFRAGDVDTAFLDAEGAAIAAAPGATALGATTPTPAAPQATPDPWSALPRWGRGAQMADGPATPASRPSGASLHSLEAPMPASVLKVFVQPGSAVRKGDTLLLLEAMKMELPLRAPEAATVAAVLCREGDLVQAGAVLVELR